MGVSHRGAQSRRVREEAMGAYSLPIDCLLAGQGRATAEAGLQRCALCSSEFTRGTALGTGTRESRQDEGEVTGREVITQRWRRRVYRVKQERDERLERSERGGKSGTPMPIDCPCLFLTMALLSLSPDVLSSVLALLSTQDALALACVCRRNLRRIGVEQT